MKLPGAKRIVSVLVCCAAALQMPHASAQTTSPRLAWDSQTSGVKGFAVTVDGVRTDYGLSPVGSNGVCGCSVPVLFSGGSHTIVVSSYNGQAEASAPPLLVAPVANPGGPYTGSPGTAIAVSGSGSNHPAGTIVKWTWSWGDGASTTAATATASHTYASAGTYAIKLAVTDNAGATASASTTATVTTASTSTAKTIVLWSANIPGTGMHGTWTRVADATAAGAASSGAADRGAAKIAPALASPANYVETTFTANAGTAYHLWLRMRAQNDSTSNDSVHVQFSDSVATNGSAAYRIGTTSSAEVVLQNGSSGAAPHAWGWADNGWGVLGDDIAFTATGTHTIRIQQREDGAFIDQIVLSPDTYLNSAPGALRDDTKVLPYTQGTPQAAVGASTSVLWAAHVAATNLHGAWQLTSDATAAGGAALWNRDSGAAKISPALASPSAYFETTFKASAGVAYHVWLRMRAQNNAYANDSVHVQFNDSVTSNGAATMRIGTTSSGEFVLQDGSSGAAPNGWGWADNGWGTMGVNVYFATTGTHTIRVQQREDGALIDQIVISGDTYKAAAPGAVRSDATLLPEKTGS